MIYNYRYSDKLMLKAIIIFLCLSFFCSIIFLIVFELNQEMFFSELSTCVVDNEKPLKCTIGAINHHYLFLNNISLLISGINNIIAVMLTFILYTLYRHKGKE